MSLRLAEARATLHPHDPRIPTNVLYEAASEAYFKVMVAGIRPDANFSARAARAGLETLTQSFWLGGEKIFFQALISAVHVPPDTEGMKVCTLVGDLDSGQGIPISLLKQPYREGILNLWRQPPTPDTERQIKDARWMISLFDKNSRPPLLTPDDPEWVKLQRLTAYNIFQERPETEKGSTYHADEALSLFMMRSPIFAHPDNHIAEALAEHQQQTTTIS